MGILAVALAAIQRKNGIRRRRLPSDVPCTSSSLTRFAAAGGRRRRSPTDALDARRNQGPPAARIMCFGWQEMQVVASAPGVCLRCIPCAPCQNSATGSVWLQAENAACTPCPSGNVRRIPEDPRVLLSHEIRLPPHGLRAESIDSRVSPMAFLATDAFLPVDVVLQVVRRQRRGASCPLPIRRSRRGRPHRDYSPKDSSASAAQLEATATASIGTTRRVLIMHSILNRACLRRLAKFLRGDRIEKISPKRPRRAIRSAQLVRLSIVSTERIGRLRRGPVSTCDSSVPVPTLP